MCSPFEQYLSVQLTSDAEMSKTINDELELIANWLCVNKLSINAKKNKYMIFHFPQRNKSSIPKLDLSIEGTVIDRVSDFNFLGISIDQHLTWKTHVSKIYTKLNRSIGVLRRLQNFLPCCVLKTLYNCILHDYQ